MPNPSEYIVDSIAAYAEKVEELLEATLARQDESPYKGNWYRGSGCAVTHSLVPSLFRHPKLAAIEELIKLERRMLDDFVRQNVLHDSDSLGVETQSDFKALFFMQHYGVPTRLLDWTGNPFIALYFALTSAEHGAGSDDFIQDAAVWVMDPVSWNKRALEDVGYGMEGPLSQDSEEARAYSPCRLIKGQLESHAIKSLYELPVAILGTANNTRMFAQRGVFTMFGKILEPMERQYDSRAFPAECLIKLVIPRGKIAELTSRLLRLGYTDSVSYPDLHGLAMEIKRTYGFRV